MEYAHEDAVNGEMRFGILTKAIPLRISRQRQSDNPLYLAGFPHLEYQPHAVTNVHRKRFESYDGLY